MIPPQKILGLFHLKWLIWVQIQLYFNRNVRQFTATTTTVTGIDVLLAAEGGSIEPVEPPPPRYGPVVSQHIHADSPFASCVSFSFIYPAYMHVCVCVYE